MKQFFINLILNLFVRTFHFTYRYQFIGLENIKKAEDQSPFKTYVLSVWHQTMFSTLTSSIGRKYALIVSRSKDGDVIANACKSFGHVPTRGSSSKGGKEALIEVIKIMKTGLPAAMAVDGPRGPFHEVKPGVIEMARLTNSAIIPWSSYPSEKWCFHKSWDKFFLPKPFSKIVIVFGDPIFVPMEINREDFEKLQVYLANKMNEGERLAMKTLGIN